MKKIIIAALITFIVPSAYANWKNGNDLFIECESLKANDERKLTRKELDDALSCQQYIQGWLDGNSTSGVPLICVPEGVMLGSISDMVSSFLEENPSKRHYPGSSIMVNALEEFECPDPFVE
jgi:hypothetical protein